MTSAEVRNWIQSELPHVQLPSEATLQALTENSTTGPLWQFLTKRALHPAHARAARAGLALCGEHYTYADGGELRELREEIRLLEKENESLRNELDGVDEICMDEVLESAFSSRCEFIQEFVEEVSYDGEGGVEEVLQEIGDEIDEGGLRRIEDVGKNASMSCVIQDLRKRLFDAERGILPVDSSVRDISLMIEEFVADATLKAYKEMMMVREEHRKGVKHVLEQVEEIGEEGYCRVLAAQVAGERAVLAFAKRRDGGVRTNSVEERDVVEVEKACQRICAGNLRILEEVKEVFCSEFADVLRKGVAAGMEHAMKMVEAGENDREVLHEGEETRTCVCALRKEEIERMDDCMMGIERRLEQRRQVAEEGRERVLERIDTKIVEEGIKRAQECRKVDCVRVRDELTAFVRQPGRNVGEWIIKG